MLFAVTVAILACCAFPDPSRSEIDPWKRADEGLLVGEFPSAPGSEARDRTITVVKIDPKRYAFKLLSASENAGETLTAKEWCRRFNLTAAINAGMFQKDGVTSVGFMKNFKHVNNPRVGRDNTILAFNPVSPDLPEIQLIDRECRDFGSLKNKYETMIQSIRMISCSGKNVWGRKQEEWSTAAVGMDKDGNALFLFGHSRQSVHDFIEALLALPLSITGAMYLEGGPQAVLYLSTDAMTVERQGFLRPDPEGTNSFHFSLPVPNVIGIVKKRN